MNAVSKLSASPSVTPPNSSNSNNSNSNNNKTKHAEFPFHDILEQVEDDDRNEADNYATFTLNKQVQELESRMSNLSDELLHNETTHQAKLNKVLFGYFPSRPSNYSQLIGPIRFVESKHRVGDYDIGPLIGDGKYAKVHCGTHRVTQKDYAIKVLAKTRLNDVRVLANLEAELHILKFVDHPNLVSFQAILHAPHNVYVVMSRAHKDLYYYVCDLDPTDVSVGMIRECMIGILRGLDYLHTNGIAHMDIKPENVLIKEDVSPNCLTRHHIQLCDFGLGEVAATPLDICPIRKFVGTSGFFAPELTALSADLDGRHADMWSLGCTMVELTQGLPPAWMEAYAKRTKDDSDGFKANLAHGLLDICGTHGDPGGGDMLLLPDTPEHLVSKLLVLEPTARWSANDCLLHAWIRAADDME
jgi:serine/threonine protein kinase